MVNERTSTEKRDLTDLMDYLDSKVCFTHITHHIEVGVFKLPPECSASRVLLHRSLCVCAAAERSALCCA